MTRHIVAYRRVYGFRGLVCGREGQWRATWPLAIDLGTRGFSGLSGRGFGVNGRVLCVARHFQWDGSTVVPDLPTCLLASLVHDCLCAGIAGACGAGTMTARQAWWTRRRADTLYAQVCVAQGMWGWRARLRFAGLRLWALVTALLAPGKRANRWQTFC